MAEKGIIIPSVHVLTGDLDEANRIRASSNVGEIDFRVIAELHHWPSRIDEVISAREEEAAASDGTCNQRITQRHQPIVPTRM
eukprot:3647364-Pyramimonas_sp.AAC.1